MSPRARPANAKEVPGPSALNHAHAHNLAGIAHRASTLRVVGGNDLIAAGHKNDVSVTAVCLGLEHGLDVLLSQLLAGRWYTSHKNLCGGL